MYLTSLEPITKHIDSFFDQVFTEPNSTLKRSNAPNEVIERDNVYILSIELPGVSKEDIHIDFEDKSLRVRATKKKLYEDDDKGVNVIANYRDYTQIDRVWGVSDSIDVKKISSEYTDGVLTIKLPKKAEAKSRKISVS